MRIMGLDYGSVTVGVAVSDSLGITAQGIEIIRRKQENKLRQTLARIEELIKEYQVERIVLGYPKNMNNTIGERAKSSEEFAGILEKRTGLPVIYGMKGLRPRRRIRFLTWPAQDGRSAVRSLISWRLW